MLRTLKTILSFDEKCIYLFNNLHSSQYNNVIKKVDNLTNDNL